MAWPTELPAHRSVARCPRAVDTRALASDDVRRVIGLCGQDAHVFGSSLRENLRLARPDAEECDLRGALDRARLLDRVDSLPAGLDTMVGEHHRPPLRRTAAAAAAGVRAARCLPRPDHGRARRTPRPLQGAAVDEILVLDHGRIAERGSWAELVDRQGGRLRDLWPRGRQAHALVAAGDGAPGG